METLTDISTDVEEAFEEMECCWMEDPHDGDKRAYVDYHGCYEGFWCAHHYQRFINEHVPIMHNQLARGPGMCSECYGLFPTLESYVKVFPL